MQRNGRQRQYHHLLRMKCKPSQYDGQVGDEAARVTFAPQIVGPDHQDYARGDRRLHHHIKQLACCGPAHQRRAHCDRKGRSKQRYVMIWNEKIKTDTHTEEDGIHALGKPTNYESRRKGHRSKAHRKPGGCGEKLTRILIGAEKSSPTILRTDLTIFLHSLSLRDRTFRIGCTHFIDAVQSRPFHQTSFHRSRFI